MADDARRLSSTAAASPAAADKSQGGAANWRNTFSSLSERNYLFLWLGMLGIMAGMQMQMLARSYLTYDITGSATLLGVVNAGNALPMLALSLFGGAFADRFDMKRIIQAGQLVFAVLALVVAFTILTGYITWQYLLLAAVIQGATFSFMMPARQAIIPHLVSREKLTNAMALSSAAMSAMTLAAPAFAGGIYAFAGAHNVYFVISALGFGAVALTNLIPSTKGATSGKKKGPIIKDIGEGLSYIRRTPFIFALLLIGLSTTVLAQPFRFLMPVFIVDIYRLGPEYMGLLVSAMGGSSLISALFVASLNKWHRGMLLIISGFMSAIALLLVAAIPIYVAGLFIMILLGVGDAGRRTLNQSLVLEEAEDQYRGRVMSVFMLNRGLMPLGVLPTAILIDIIGAQFAIGLLGIVLGVITAYILVTQKRLREYS